MTDKPWDKTTSPAYVATLEQQLVLAEGRLEGATNARIKQLEDENALLKRALAMLTRSLEDAETESTR